MGNAANMAIHPHDDEIKCNRSLLLKHRVNN